MDQLEISNGHRNQGCAFCRNCRAAACSDDDVSARSHHNCDHANDSGPGSLRQALAVAHDGDRITFAVGGTITLTSGGLGVTKNVTISGPGVNQLSIDGNQATLVFGVPPQRAVSISGLSIRNAQFGISNNQGTVSVSNCVISGNSVAGLYNYAGQGFAGASMTVANSIISNNSGTGAFNQSISFLCACMTITDSVVSNNTEDGIYNSASGPFGVANAGLTVVNSNVSNNVGRGISNDVYEGGATATIVSTMVSGNSAGGVFNSGGVWVAVRELQLPIAPSAGTRPTVGSTVEPL